MTRKSSPSIDGFVPRRANSQMGEHHSLPAPKPPENPGRFGLQRSSEGLPPTVASNHGLLRSEVDESLRGIDEPDELVKKKGFLRRRRKNTAAAPSRRRRIIRWVIIALLVIGIGIGIFVGIKTLLASNNIFKGNIFDILQNQPLKQDASGRSNILLFGTSEDDPGHEAPYLTDSIIVLSIDQTNKNAYMFSIPRDLEVEYGTACAAGYRGKINVVYGCHYDDGNNEDAGAGALREKVAEVTGLDIQYSAHVNYTVVREAVGAVGGVDITIESRDPRGQMDSNFDWKCGVGDRKVTRAQVLQRCPPSGHYIDYPNGPVHLDAEHALYLAQARGDLAPTYGFEQSNFDREKNQQKIIKALRDKALSAGTIANVTKVSKLIDAFGNNLRTNFETKEINTLFTLVKDIPNDKIQSISLVDGDTPVLNGDGNPAAGKYEFGDLQAFIKLNISSDPFVKEKSNVAVFNGSGIAGVAQTEADKLEAQSFMVSSVATAPEGTYGDIEIYQITADKPATAKKLQEVFGVALETTTPPVSAPDGTNFVIIFGKARS